jgi:hypothetical protein
MLVLAGRRPVAVAAGYLEAYSTTAAARTQHVVVVREDWTVLLFDHKLRLRWETAVGSHVDAMLGADRSLYELCDVGVLITRLSATTTTGGSSGGSSSGGGGGSGGGGVHAQEGDTGGMVVVSGRLRRKGGALDGGKAVNDRLEAYLQHFSFYALEGRSGAVAWSHEGGGSGGSDGGFGGVGGTSPSKADALATATGHAARAASSSPKLGQYLLDPSQVSLELGPIVGGYAAHAGGGGGGGAETGTSSSKKSMLEDWTSFRSSVLKFALPHGWESPSDTRLEVISDS